MGANMRYVWPDSEFYLDFEKSNANKHNISSRLPKTAQKCTSLGEILGFE